MLKDAIAEAFSPCQRPDSELAICLEISISSALANEEEGSGFLEEERVRSRLLVAFRSVIGPCYQSNSRNGHLSIQDAFDLMIIPALQGKGVQGLATIVARLRKSLFDCSERLNGAFQVLIRFYQESDASSYLHTNRVPLRAYNSKHLVEGGRQFPHGSRPLAAIWRRPIREIANGRNW